MKGKIHEHTAGLVVGCILGVWHALWSFMVAGNMAQTLLDWIYSIHFLNNPFRVQPFDISKAIILVAVTSLIGYLIGWFFAFLWNNAMKKK